VHLDRSLVESKGCNFACENDHQGSKPGQRGPQIKSRDCMGGWCVVGGGSDGGGLRVVCGVVCEVGGGGGGAVGGCVEGLKVVETAVGSSSKK